MIYFENEGDKHLASKDLAALIQRAQQKDAEAIKRLCSAYEGLIRKLCNNADVRTYLGYEDAVNSCFVFLLELIMNYKGNNYELFPGLVETVVGGRLRRHVYFGKRRCCTNDSFEALTSREVAPLILEAPSTNFDQALIIEELLKPFEPLDREIIKCFYFKEHTLDEVAKELAITRSKVRYRLNRIKKSLIFLKKEDFI